jgi:hypothetical protein
MENWPSFVICGLKPLPAHEAISWLIVEQTYVRQQPLLNVSRTPWSHVAPPFVLLGYFWQVGCYEEAV